MNQSPTIGSLAAALAKVQGEIKGAKKDATNPFYRSTYADLSSVKDACQSALTAHGIAVIQSPSAEGAKVSITTMLCHESGEWVAGSITATAKDESAQSVGSVITYLRRYALASMVGVTAEDDDGESAQPRPSTPSQRIVAAASSIDDKQALLRASRIKVLIARHGDGFKAFCKKKIGKDVASGRDLTDSDLDNLEASASDVA